MNPAELAAVLQRKSLLIFDLDGTLVDSSPLHARAFDAAFERHGVSVDYPSIAGLTTESAVARIAGDHRLLLAEEERSDLARNKRRIVQDLIAGELIALDGAVEFVERAAARWPLALCTSGSRATVAATLGRIGLLGRFDPLVTAGDVPSKPDPAGYLRVLELRQTSRADALIFEDSASGLAAAAVAGVDAVCILADGGAPPSSDDSLAPSPVACCAWPPLLGALGELGL